MTLLDTNIVIAYLNGEESVVTHIDAGRQNDDRFCVSAITVTELLAFPRLTMEERTALTQWMQKDIFVISIDTHLATMAGDLCRGTRLRAADGIIAATALRMQVPLVTRDRDFLHVPGLAIVTI